MYSITKIIFLIMILYREKADKTHTISVLMPEYNWSLSDRCTLNQHPNIGKLYTWLKDISSLDRMNIISIENGIGVEVVPDTVLNLLDNECLAYDKKASTLFIITPTYLKENYEMIISI